MTEQATDHITPEEAQTLSGLFRERVRRSPQLPAYRFFDMLNEIWTDASWGAMQRDIDRWCAALAGEKLKPGDRVAIMARNSRFWVMFDQAALALGLVVVPLYTEDRAGNVSYILQDAEATLLVIGGIAQWRRLKGHLTKNKGLKRIVSIGHIDEIEDKRMRLLRNWVPGEPGEPEELPCPQLTPDSLATIVYTSGTTGRPKGVKLSHKNILSNAYNSLKTFPVEPASVFLSFLPLSHTLERTIGYYLPVMAGATVAHARSIPALAKDLPIIKPQGLISVPRIYERVYARIQENLQEKSGLSRSLFALAVEVGWHRFEVEQGRAKRKPSLMLWPVLKSLVADKILQKLGGRLQVAVSGGAPLSPEVAKVFIGLGVPVLQGYGLTEAGPVIGVNRLDENIPASIGPAIDDVEVKIGEQEELLARGDNVMLGYWNNDEATRRTIDEDGWLHTGDKAKIEGGHIYITGRLKDIIVMANGEKIPPVDMELAISADNVFEQVMIVGESRPYLSALAVLNEACWGKVLEEQGLSGRRPDGKEVEALLLERIADRLHDFPGYARVRRVRCTAEPWSVDNGLLTPTLKIKRPAIQKKYLDEIEYMYAGH